MHGRNKSGTGSARTKTERGIQDTTEGAKARARRSCTRSRTLCPHSPSRLARVVGLEIALDGGAALGGQDRAAVPVGEVVRFGLEEARAVAEQPVSALERDRETERRPKVDARFPLLLALVGLVALLLLDALLLLARRAPVLLVQRVDDGRPHAARLERALVGQRRDRFRHDEERDEVDERGRSLQFEEVVS